MVNFAGDYDPLKQIDQIQDAIASQSFDALLIHPLDSKAAVPAVQDALDAGLAVVNRLIGNGFNLLNVPLFYQSVFQGAIIIFAVSLDTLSRRQT